MYRGRQSIWPLYDVGTPIPSWGAHHGGGSQTVNPSTPYWAWLSLHLGAAQQGCLPCTTPQGGAPEHPRLREVPVMPSAEGSVNYRSDNSSAWFPDSLYCRTQWVWGPHDSLPTRANGQRSQPTWQQTYLPKGGHPTAPHRGARTQSSAPWQSPSFYPDCKPCQTSSTEGGRRGEHEVRELLSQVELDTSEHASGSSTPKGWEPMVLVTPLPTKLKDFPKPVDMSSQVSALYNAEMEEASLEDIPTPSSPTTEAQGLSSDAPPPDAAHLWKKPTRL